MATKSIQTNAKTPSDTVVPQLRQEKKVCNHKNQRNEDPTGGLPVEKTGPGRYFGKRPSEGLTAEEEAQSVL